MTSPLSSEPSAAAVGAIGDWAVTVRVVAAAPVFVTVRSVTAVSLYVMYFRSRTDSPPPV